MKEMPAVRCIIRSPDGRLRRAMDQDRAPGQGSDQESDRVCHRAGSV